MSERRETYATARESIISAAYDGQQSSQRELELLYHAMTQRALTAEAESAALKQQLANVQQEVDVLATLQEQALRNLEQQRDRAIHNADLLIQVIQELRRVMERAAAHLPGQPDLAERVLSRALETNKAQG